MEFITYKFKGNILSRGDFEGEWDTPEQAKEKDEMYKELARQVESGEIEEEREVEIKFIINPIFDKYKEKILSENKQRSHIFLDTSK